MSLMTGNVKLMMQCTCNNILFLQVTVADPGGSGARPPPAAVKTSKKRWPPSQAASFVSHRAPPRTNFWIRY